MNQATKKAKRRRKTEFIDISDMIIFFFKLFFDEYSYNTPYPQHCTDKKKQFENIFYL